MVELVVRVTLSLALVLGLFWLVARFGSRRFVGANRTLLRVVGRQSLGRNASLAVVEVGERVLVVGVGDGGVRLLTELDPTELAPADLGSGVDPGLVAVGELEVDQADAAGPGASLPGPSRPRPGIGLVGVPSLTRPPVVGKHSAATSASPFAGSVLSAQTWRQAWASATARNGTGS